MIGSHFNDVISVTSNIFNRNLAKRGECFVRKLSERRFEYAKSLYNKTIPAHYGCVNAIEFSPKLETYLASGSDDKRVLVWNVGDLMCDAVRPKPYELKCQHNSNVFCLAFSDDLEYLLSAGNDAQIIVHDMMKNEAKDVYLLSSAIYSLNMHPSSNSVFCAASDEGKIALFDLRAPGNEDPSILAKSNFAYQSAMFNPVESTLVISSNAKDGIQLWDTRKPKKQLKVYKNDRGTRSAMAARWNASGDLILGLRRRQLPSVYHISHEKPVLFFDDANYINCCTLKSCTFGGPNDQFIFAGSDSFDSLVWRLPEDFEFSPRSNASRVVQPASLTLIGHRSIVNQIRYSKVSQLVASSGVEKVIKLWSAWPLVNGRGRLTLTTDLEPIINESDPPCYSPKRIPFTVAEYRQRLDNRGESRDATEGQDNLNNVDEDPNMLAFFDNIVRLEMTGLTDRNESDDSSTSSEVEVFPLGRARFLVLRSQRYNNEIVSSSSSESDDDILRDILSSDHSPSSTSSTDNESKATVCLNRRTPKSSVPFIAGNKSNLSGPSTSGLSPNLNRNSTSYATDSDFNGAENISSMGDKCTTTNSKLDAHNEAGNVKKLRILKRRIIEENDDNLCDISDSTNFNSIPKSSQNEDGLGDECESLSAHVNPLTRRFKLTKKRPKMSLRHRSSDDDDL